MAVSAIPSCLAVRRLFGWRFRVAVILCCNDDAKAVGAAVCADVNVIMFPSDIELCCHGRAGSQQPTDPTVHATVHFGQQVEVRYEGGRGATHIVT